MFNCSTDNGVLFAGNSGSFQNSFHKSPYNGVLVTRSMLTCTSPITAEFIEYYTIGRSSNGSTQPSVLIVLAPMARMALWMPAWPSLITQSYMFAMIALAGVPCP